MARFPTLTFDFAIVVLHYACITTVGAGTVCSLREGPITFLISDLFSAQCLNYFALYIAEFSHAAVPSYSPGIAAIASSAATCPADDARTGEQRRTRFSHVASLIVHFCSRLWGLVIQVDLGQVSECLRWVPILAGYFKSLSFDNQHVLMFVFVLNSLPVNR